MSTGIWNILGAKKSLDVISNTYLGYAVWGEYWKGIDMINLGVNFAPFFVHVQYETACVNKCLRSCGIMVIH